MAKQSRPIGRGQSVSVEVEPLELRRHLSHTVFKTGHRISVGHTYRPPSDAVARSNRAKTSRAHTNLVGQLAKGVATPAGSTGPVGYVPAQIRQAYGLTNLTFGTAAADGTGQTIAIIDAYDDPAFVSSTDPNFANSDLHQFDMATGLPDPPSFTKIDQSGGTNYPAANGGWATEIALDVEYAHAVAPAASIVLVEAASSYLTDLITAAANAAALPGVSVVSMSFGVDGGGSGESFFDQYFTTPANHAGVTFLAATGDHGAVKPAGGTTYSGDYPAESPNVVAVGGTTLSVDGGGNYAGETAWVGSGGGISNYEAKPAYQAAVTQSTTSRTVPDVAIDGNPATGVALYDSYNNGTATPWFSGYYGGTSLSAPLWAGMVALADQARAVRGQASLDGVSQTLPRLYQLPAGDFHDVVSGNNRYDGANGYDAATGYDLVTGLGTPTASLLTDLAGGRTYGTAFADNNSDGILDGSDAVLPGVTVYNDANNNGILDSGEPSATTDANGVYSLDLPGGITYRLRQVAPTGYAAVGPAYLTGSTTYGDGTAGTFADFPTAYTATAATAFTVKLSTDGSTLQVYQNSTTPTYTAPVGLAGSLSFAGGNGDDSLTIDLTNGNPIPTNGITFAGGGQTTGDVINVVAPTGGSNVTVTGNLLTIGGNAVSFSGIEGVNDIGSTGNDSLTDNAGQNVAFTPGGGSDTLSVTGATFVVPADLSASGSSVSVTGGNGAVFNFTTSQHLAGLTLANGAAAVLPGSGKVLRTGTLSVTGTSFLNLQSNSLIVNAPDANAASLLASGYAAGAWNGAGVRSSTAAADTTKTHALGYAVASAASVFAGESVAAGAFLARYTLYGDANLDGGVTISDFNALSARFGTNGVGWVGGDFNYDNAVTIADFNLLAVDFGRSA